MQNIRDNFPSLKTESVKWLLAVSGGVDSIVLCDLVKKSGINFIIAHCNFQLRGAESDRDEAFVRRVGAQFGKEVLVKAFDAKAFAAEHKISIQLAARQLRYQWFHELIAGETTASTSSPTALAETTETPKIIVTAHHANDHIETLLMNFFKGTGISGLHGILPLQNHLFRPLLIFKKEELLQYATQNNIDYVEDSSNESDKYTRNFFRHQLMPVLKEIYPQVEDNLLKNIERFTEAELLYKQAIETHKKKLLEFNGNEVHIPVLKLKKTVPIASVVYEIIKDYGFSTGQVEEVIALLESGSGKLVSSASHRIIRNRKWLIIAPNNTLSQSTIVIEAGENSVAFERGNLQLEQKKMEPGFTIPTSPNIACVNAKAISFPLLFRKWKQGDYFYPLGMKKKKKVSRFLIDKKLSKTDKEKVWVLEMNKKIVWLPGLRIDDRFKVEPNTTEILQLVWEPAKA